MRLQMKRRLGKQCLNGFACETDKKLLCLGTPRGLLLTFIHSVIDLWK